MKLSGVSYQKEKEIILGLKEGHADTDRIFSPEEFQNDADLHYQRQLRAVEVYERVVEDMKQHPERRDYYKEQIYQKYAERNRTCRENLDNPYCVRGANRQRLLAEGREVTYDRVALLYVSTHVLSHKCIVTVILGSSFLRDKSATVSTYWNLSCRPFKQISVV